jgi:hypothetical protein
MRTAWRGGPGRAGGLPGLTRKGSTCALGGASRGLTSGCRCAMPKAREKRWSNSRGRRENKAETLYRSGNKGRAINVVLPALSRVATVVRAEPSDQGIIRRRSGGYAVQDAAHTVTGKASSFGLERHGLHHVTAAHWNLSVPLLYEHAIRRREGLVAAGGAFVAGPASSPGARLGTSTSSRSRRAKPMSGGATSTSR